MTCLKNLSPRTEFTTNPPLAGAYTPKKGDICAAKFVDDQWYRARVEKMSTVSATSLSRAESKYSGVTLSMNSLHNLMPGTIIISGFKIWYIYSLLLIMTVSPQTDVAVLYIDYGNRATVPKTKLGSLPASFTATSGYAKLFNLALVTLPQVTD